MEDHSSKCVSPLLCIHSQTDPGALSIFVHTERPHPFKLLRGVPHYCHCPVDGHFFVFSVSYCTTHYSAINILVHFYVIASLGYIPRSGSTQRFVLFCFVLIKYVYLLLNCCYVSGTMLGVLQKQSHLLLLPSYK